MGISCNTRNIFSIIPLLLLFVTSSSSSSFSPTDIVTKNLLNKLCLEFSILSHGFCVKWLAADITKNSINIHALTELTVDKTLGFGQKNQLLLSDFERRSGNDKQLKEAYKSCVNSYGVVITELEKAKEFLRKNSWRQAFFAASNALDYAYSCKDQFEGPSSEPSFVVDHEDMFIEMCHIVKAFTALFNQNS